jgi:hypothetical protein
MTRYGKLTVGLITAWFLFALFASAFHLFKNEQERIGIAVALAALIPILLFSIWFAGSNTFRQFALSLNPRALTLAQTWRIGGIVFVLLETRGILPAFFALPAGYGDIFIGATAWFAALKLANPDHRSSFIGWQLLGMTDLIMAVGLGTTARLFNPQGTSMLAMTVLPMSLVPTFFVPLLFVFHIINIAQARSWRATVDAKPGEKKASSTFGSNSAKLLSM